MRKISRFEDLECWKAARILSKHIFLVSNTAPLVADRETRSQLKQAAISIMNNIAEGFGRFSEKDALRFFDMAGPPETK